MATYKTYKKKSWPPRNPDGTGCEVCISGYVRCDAKAIGTVDIHHPCGHRLIGYRVCKKHWDEVFTEQKWRCMECPVDSPRYTICDTIRDWELIRT